MQAQMRAFLLFLFDPSLDLVITKQFCFAAFRQ